MWVRLVPDVDRFKSFLSGFAGFQSSKFLLHANI